jgi:hypothetical protein
LGYESGSQTVVIEKSMSDDTRKNLKRIPNHRWVFEGEALVYEKKFSDGCGRTKAVQSNGILSVD